MIHLLFKKQDSPDHKRRLLRMQYMGESLPIGVRLWNQQKIEWTMQHVIIPQCMSNNEGENQIEAILKKHGYSYSKQHPIVIAGEDKAIKHIFLVDFLVKQKVLEIEGSYHLVEREIIIEVDGCYHEESFDTNRDKLIRELGYRILRIPRADNCYDENKVIADIEKLLH